MTFQVWKNDEWKTVFMTGGITKVAYTESFEPVTTSKVRFCDITSSMNATRWIEIEVYGYSTVNPLLPESDTKVFLKDGKSIGQITHPAMTVQTTGNQTVVTHPRIEKLTFAEPVETNVALGKPVTASDILDPNNAMYQPANAVDGNYAAGAAAPRWVSATSGEHWLEIDLQGAYRISSFKTWNNGTGSDYGYPVTRLKLQAWLEDGWVDVADSGTGNSDPCYGAEFEPVTTSKVRLYAYSMVRLLEIAVYGIRMY
jgi:hypothetical protein